VPTPVPTPCLQSPEFRKLNFCSLCYQYHKIESRFGRVMSFKVASKFIEAGKIANGVAKGDFEAFLVELCKRLSEDSSELFSDAQMTKMSNIFDLDSSSLRTLIGGCCYAFEQAAFTGTSAEDLFELLVDQVGFAESHAKLLGRCWSREEKGFKEKLKKKTLGAREMVGLNYHLNITMADNNMRRILEPTALFEFTLSHGDESLSSGKANTSTGEARATGFGANPPMQPQAFGTSSTSSSAATGAGAGEGTSNNNSRFAVELTHSELYDWFQQIEEVQHALDAMAPS